MTRPPLPPFTEETAPIKARAAEDVWNSQDPARIALAYTPDCVWRHRAEFVNGRAEIEAFLHRKWSKEFEYRLVKEVWGFRLNRMAIRFCYESRDKDHNWSRAYGIELWEFDEAGLMRRRVASINDLPILEKDRLFRWTTPVRPTDHPGLTELGL